MSSFKMKDLPLSERPYERLKSFGASQCSDAELLSIIIRSGFKNKSSLDIARSLLKAHKGYEGLEALQHYSLKEFCQIEGIGEVKAFQLLALLELSKRFHRTSMKKQIPLTNPSDIAQLFMEKLRYEEVEYVHIVFLNTKYILLGEKRVSQGNIQSSIFPIREILIEALKENAVAIVMIHNHPSGDPSPSRADIDVSQTLKEGAHQVGIHLLDHIIIGNGIYCSLKEKGYLS